MAPSFATLLQGPLLSRAGTDDLSNRVLDFMEVSRDWGFLEDSFERVCPPH